MSAALDGSDNDRGHSRDRGCSAGLPIPFGLILDRVLKEFRIRGARADHGDVDPGRCQFSSQGIAPAVKGKLAGTILAFQWHGSMPQNAADFDNDG